MNKRKAVYGGSFDPPHKGHEWVIREGSKLFDKLIVAIFTNPDKKSMFSLEERLEMLRAVTRDMPNVEIDCDNEKLLARYAADKGLSYSLRGVRNGKDYDYEANMAKYNSDINPEMRTVLLASPAEFEKLSSSAIRGLVGFDGWQQIVGKYVSQEVLERIKTKYGGQK